jgi:hypothetical protein
MLHTDHDEMIFEGQRPVLLNGIPLLTDRADLADRAVTILFVQCLTMNASLKTLCGKPSSKPAHGFLVRSSTPCRPRYGAPIAAATDEHLGTAAATQEEANRLSVVDFWQAET